MCWEVAVEARRESGSPESGITGSCELPNVDTGNQTLLLSCPSFYVELKIKDVHFHKT